MNRIFAGSGTLYLRGFAYACESLQIATAHGESVTLADGTVLSPDHYDVDEKAGVVRLRTQQIEGKMTFDYCAFRKPKKKAQWKSEINGRGRR